MVQWLKFHLLMQGVWFPSLVWELRSHRPPGQNTKTKQKQYCNKFNNNLNFFFKGYRRNEVLRSRPRVHRHTSCSHLLKLMSPQLLPLSQPRWKKDFCITPDKDTMGRKEKKTKHVNTGAQEETEWQITTERCSTSSNWPLGKVQTFL